MIGIYKITNPNKKVYIGSSINIDNRLRHYRNNSSKGQIKLYNSIKKYGWENHSVEIIEECNIENLYERERYYGLLYNVLRENGLNLLLPKVGEAKGLVSDETKLRMKNRKGGYKGFPHSEESKEKIRKIQLGRKHSPEHRKKVSENSAKTLSKPVIDLETGIYYDSITTLKQRVNGQSPTPTSITFIN